MATLVLTTVGGLVGGPIGAAIGSVLGRQVDQAVLFRPRRREGPRLSELAVQTSSYGAPVQRVFGTMRVAGSVIWSTDLIETRSTSGGGKGRPSTTSYSYSASFAVLLSGRPVRRVLRIWADGKLLRGAGGDFKSALGAFRLHPGTEDQAVDPLIASAERLGATPAHRGCAYAVFERLALADFGNRIPSLTFEVEAEAGPVDVAAILAELSDGRIAGAASGLELTGYAAYGSSVIGLADALAGATGIWFGDEAGQMVPRRGAGLAREVLDQRAAAAGRAGRRDQRVIAAADQLPGEVAIAHYDPARDYQTGTQQAMRGGKGRRRETIELPAAIAAGMARGLAEQALARAGLERETRQVATDWAAIAVAPGDRVTIAGEAGQWRVRSTRLDAMVLTLELVRVTAVPVAVPASPGRVRGAPDLRHGETRLIIVEAPLTDEAPRDRPVVIAAACGEDGDWRRADLMLSVDGVDFAEAGPTGMAAAIGAVSEPLAAGPATIVDRLNRVTVTLFDADAVLADADPRRLDQGANAALIGDELIQFERAEPLGQGRWRLSGLWRGRRGTEWAIGGHMPGEAFVPVDPEQVRMIELSTSAIGSIVTMQGQGIGDPEPVIGTTRLDGRSVAPPAPVHGRATTLPGGGHRIEWTRRSRSGWAWIDGIDLPDDADGVRFAVRLIGPGGEVARIETTGPELTIDPALAPLTGAEVRQIGRLAPSAPLYITF